MPTSPWWLPARRYGDLTAVDGVSFRIDTGETYGLLGPNGAGKTTTTPMVAGLVRADAGSVTVAGQAMGPGQTEVKRHIGLVPGSWPSTPSSRPG